MKAIMSESLKKIIREGSFAEKFEKGELRLSDTQGVKLPRSSHDEIFRAPKKGRQSRGNQEKVAG